MAARNGFVIALFVVMVGTLTAWGQPPCEVWRWRGVSGRGFLGGAIATADSGFLLAGSTGIPGTEMTSDIRITKLTATGQAAWDRTIHMTSYEYCSGILSLLDGGAILTGTTGVSWVWPKVLAVRVNIGGDTVWTRSYYDIAVGDVCTGSCRATDGTVVLVGIWNGFNGLGSVSLRKITLTGEPVWSRVFRIEYTETHQVVVCPDGGYAIVGASYHQDGQNWTNSEAFLLRVNSEGDSLWTAYHHPRVWNDWLSVVPTSDGGFLLAGAAENATTAAMLARLDAHGNIVWSQVVSSTDNQAFYWIGTGSGPRYLLAGGTWPASGEDYLAEEIDDNGRVFWTKTWTDATEDGSARIAVRTFDSGYAIAGHSFPHNNTNNARFRVYRTEADPIPSPPSSFDLISPEDNAAVSGWGVQFLWHAAHDSNTCDSVHYCVALSGDSLFTDTTRRAGLVDTTYFWYLWGSQYSGSYWWRVAAYDLGADTVWSSARKAGFTFNTADDRASLTPTAYSLHPNYPNPFNPTTEIVYDLPRTEHVSLKVFDLLGREVMTLASGRVEAGNYRVSFDGSGLPSGIYVYQLQAGAYTESRKMVLLR